MRTVRLLFLSFVTVVFFLNTQAGSVDFGNYLPLHEPTAAVPTDRERCAYTLAQLLLADAQPACLTPTLDELKEQCVPCCYLTFLALLSAAWKQAERLEQEKLINSLSVEELRDFFCFNSNKTRGERLRIILRNGLE
jgi:hypothetical protein